MTVRDLFGLQLEAARAREAVHRALGLALEGSDADLIKIFHTLLNATKEAEKAVQAASRRTRKIVPFKGRNGR